MKKFERLLLTFILIFASVISVSFLPCESSNLDTVVSLQIDNPTMQVNGKNTQIDNGRQTAPVIINKRTLVPIRAIIEAFGGNVSWDGKTRTVTLNIGDDTVKLIIDSTLAYFNNTSKTLDVSPAIINDRTMLPIRFIAESFNFGVGWNSDTRMVYIVRNSFDDEEYEKIYSMIPSYSGEPYVELNNNKPFFKDYEIIDASFEFYAELDELGRCDVAMASVGTDIMPKEARKSISSVIPTGWKNASYDFISGKYIYNRCHLIGFQLTGENANKRNLITGTRYLNVDGMLPFENIIDDYVEKTNNNVMYRVTPVFTENNLLADGVLMEAYSVEDKGEGISFCIYCYNVQPNVYINYATGENSLKN